MQKEANGAPDETEIGLQRWDGMGLQKGMGWNEIVEEGETMKGADEGYKRGREGGKRKEVPG